MCSRVTAIFAIKLVGQAARPRERPLLASEQDRCTLTAKKITNVLSDAEREAIVKRIKRAQGQLGAVARMLEEGRSCNEIITRCQRFQRRSILQPLL